MTIRQSAFKAAFDNAKIKGELIIPERVKNIGADAFSDNGNQLKANADFGRKSIQILPQILR